MNKICIQDFCIYYSIHVMQHKCNQALISDKEAPVALIAAFSLFALLALCILSSS